MHLTESHAVQISVVCILRHLSYWNFFFEKKKRYRCSHCNLYPKDTVMLFVGGLFVACTIEHRNLHRRIALSVLKVVGSDPKMLMLGVMLPTWFLSMWMSNTATTAMMITIVEAVIISMDAIEVGE
ncbi:hypothetical protein T265_06877 [Opisthorchis viverrini]|uniref:Citrate transporter-like domain-containing protein n=1 Tax=Opisthorchis viverrini TaxID=6198 RepID=A0A075ACY2_OPIVI|nr:hypothetical protein T265_06877 [Opisthorchis viverrini]KER25704.1 hypothetical protein T265_06877 [Opisthorchis viverrini]